MRLIIPLSLLLLSVSPAAQDFTSQVKDANEFMLGVANKMPLWDKDNLGQFERREIATVKDDILAAQGADSPNEFLHDIDHLRTDWDALNALDEVLRIERVI